MHRRGHRRRRALSILSGHNGGWDLAKDGLGQNGWSEYSTASAFIAEFVGTFLFLVVILGATSEKGSTTVAGVAIGVALLVIHINLIRVTGTSVNPARSLGPALVRRRQGAGAALAVHRRADRRRDRGGRAVPREDP